MDLKTCSRCGQEKAVAEMRPGKTWCNDCQREWKAEWLKRPGVKDRQRWHRFRNRLAQYGLTPVDYMRMLDAQNGVCAICRQSCKSGRDLAVDHCHATGVTRGLLCTVCNFLVGRRENNNKYPADLLAAADQYLVQYGAGSPVLAGEAGLGPLPSRRRVKAEKPKDPDWAAQKLTREVVVDIRRRVATGEARRAIARELGVANTTVSRICTRELWPHVE